MAAPFPADGHVVIIAGSEGSISGNAIAKAETSESGSATSSDAGNDTGSDTVQGEADTVGLVQTTQVADQASTASAADVATIGNGIADIALECITPF